MISSLLIAIFARHHDPEAPTTTDPTAEALRRDEGGGVAEDVSVYGAEDAELADALWGGIGATVVGVGLMPVLGATGAHPERDDAHAVPAAVRNTR